MNSLKSLKSDKYAKQIITCLAIIDQLFASLSKPANILMTNHKIDASFERYIRVGVPG